MKTGVLLVNLGTPKSYDPKVVKSYLEEFLLDPYVIDIPWVLRWLLVRCVIVPLRYKKTAKLYESIWSKEGSPLMTNSLCLMKKLQESLGEDFVVDIAMRYHDRKIEEGVNSLINKGVEKIIFVPLFPQFANATSGSIFAEIEKLKNKYKFTKSFEFIKSYPTQNDMIQAYADRINEMDVKNYDHIVLSFHGLPVRHLKKIDNRCYEKECCSRDNVSDCYRKQCYETARSIIKLIDRDENDFTISFQSRLGSDPWIKPFTQETLNNLLIQGKKKILVACPSFVSDCIETLCEIEKEYKEEFLHSGGEKLDLVPSLNDHPKWIEGLKRLILTFD